MAIGLKLRDVRRFGQKVQKGVNVFARKLGKTADVVGSVVAPLATAIGGPEAGMAVAKAVESVKGGAKGVQRITGKGVGKSEELFKQIQQPILAGREIVREAKGAMKNPQQAQIRIGETLVNRGLSRPKPSIQRDSQNQSPYNEWNELPFASM